MIVINTIILSTLLVLYDKYKPLKNISNNLNNNQIKNILFIAQIILIITEWINILGSVISLNNNYYLFTMIILLFGFIDYLAFQIANRKDEYIIYILTTSLKIIVSLHFNYKLNIFGYGCKLLLLLILEPIFNKLKNNIMNEGIYSDLFLSNNNYMNIGDIKNFLEKKYFNNVTTDKLKKTNEYVFNEIEKANNKINTYLIEFKNNINNQIDYLFKFRLFALIIILYFIEYVKLTNDIYGLLLLLKIFDYIFNSGKCIFNLFQIIKCDMIRNYSLINLHYLKLKFNS